MERISYYTMHKNIHTYKGEICDIKHAETDSNDFMDGKQAAVHENEKHPDCGDQKDVPLFFPFQKRLYTLLMQISFHNVQE